MSDGILLSQKGKMDFAHELAGPFDKALTTLDGGREIIPSLTVMSFWNDLSRGMWC